MKRIKIILGLILFASVSTFAQSPRIKLNQITKDTVKGSVLISSPTDSGMVYSRDFYIAYGADTVLILYGDTLASTSGIISSVLSDGVTITGNGTSGNELKVDTSLIATIKALNDSLATISASTTPDNVTITGDGSVGNPLKVDTLLIATIKGLNDTLTARNYLAVSQLTDTLNANTRGYLTAEVDGSISNEGSLTVGAGTASTSVISSNTSGSTDVTLTAGSNITLSETGNNITIAATGGGASYNNISENGDTVIISDHLKVDTNTLFVDATTNRVGIGTSSPTQKLSISGTSASNAGIYGSMTNLQSQGFAGLFVEADKGNDPDYAYATFQVLGSDVESIGYTGLNNASRFRTGPGINKLIMATGASKPIIFQTNDTDRMTIDGNGNVGIGTSSPLAKLSVKGGIALTDPTVGFGSNTADNPLVYIYDDSQTTSGATDAEFSFFVAGQGSTAASQGPVFGMRGKNFSRFSGARGRVFFLAAQDILNPTGDDGTMEFITNGGSLKIEYDGDVVISSLGTGTVYSASGVLTNTNPSDANLKTDINDINYGLTTVMNLKPKTYYYKNDTINTNLRFGFIAQDVAEVIPEAVGFAKNNEYMFLNNDAIYATYAKAIQEQQTIIETQQSEIDQLKTLITDLTNRIQILENK